MTYFLPDSPLLTAAQKAVQAASRGGGGGGSSAGLRLEFKLSRVTIYRPVLDYYLHNQDGQLGRFLKKRGRLIMALAKRQVGVDTGELKNSIRMIHQRTAVWAQLKIGSNLSHAYMHHEGTQPHIITPKDANILRFSSGGRVIYTHEVNHPGTRPNRYLSDQLWVARI